MISIRIPAICSSVLGEMRDLIVPAFCQLCDQKLGSDTIGGVCEVCVLGMPTVQRGCTHCGAELPEFVDRKKNCPHCRTTDSRAIFDKAKWPARRVYAYGTYRDKLSEAVVRMKSPGSEGIAFSVGHAMANWFKLQLDSSTASQGDAAANHVQYDAVVSTPKHWLRRIQQQHNSSDLLAEVIARQLSLPLRLYGLSRIRQTAKQGTLQSAHRRRNVEGAFATNSWYPWKSTNILLIDDIVTSGSTASEMTKSLLRSGVSNVDILCVARGVGFGGNKSDDTRSKVARSDSDRG